MVFFGVITNINGVSAIYDIPFTSLRSDSGVAFGPNRDSSRTVLVYVVGRCRRAPAFLPAFPRVLREPWHSSAEPLEVW
jgi:hypothetical protein